MKEVDFILVVYLDIWSGSKLIIKMDPEYVFSLMIVIRTILSCVFK